MDFSNLIPLVKESPINSSGKKCKLSNDESKRENHVLKEAHRLLKKPIAMSPLCRFSYRNMFLI